MKWCINIAVCLALPMGLAPMARAQRVQPEAHDADASVHAGVDEQSEKGASPKKAVVRSVPRSTWTGTADQPAKSLFRPSVGAPANNGAASSAFAEVASGARPSRSAEQTSNFFAKPGATTSSQGYQTAGSFLEKNAASHAFTARQGRSFQAGQQFGGPSFFHGQTEALGGGQTFARPKNSPASKSSAAHESDDSPISLESAKPQ